MARKVIFDTDIGDDDAIALTALFLSQDVEVIAITTTQGNLPLENVVDNALRMVSYFDKDIPVYKGCSTPMVRTLTPGRAANTLMQNVEKYVDGKKVTIHFETLPLPKSNRKVEDKHACSYIVKTLTNTKEKIDICAIGPLTNIAMALRLNPSIVDNIGTIYIMGGGIYKANRTPAAEANFYEDPEAAEIVLNSGANIVLCPIEGCETGAIFDINDLAYIGSIDNKAAKFVYDVIDGYTKRAEILFGKSASECCVYDYAAIAALLDSNVISESSDEVCHVEIGGGMADGELVIDHRPYTPFKRNAHVIYEEDNSKAKELLFNLLKQYE